MAYSKMVHQLAIASLIHNNAFFLKEWIEFHLMMGVEKFYLGNHFSTDNSVAILRPYIQRGIVELETITQPFVNVQQFEREIHCPFYTRILKKCVGQAKWLACIDSDEFITPLIPHTTIPQCLDKSDANRLHGDVLGGIVLNWKVFGTSNTNVPPNKLITETLIRTAPTEQRFIKTILLPERTLHYLYSPHYPIYQPDYYAMTQDGTQVNGDSVQSTPRYTLNIRHYVNGDLHYFDTVKSKTLMQPGWPDNIRLKKRHAANDVVEDARRRWFVPGLRRRMFGL